MSNPCEAEGFNYNCSTPTPRSAFADGPLCDSLAQFLYDPANCEPGYFCGCSSTNPDLCLPSNDTSITAWGGYYTTKDDTGEDIVLVGWFQESSKCPPSYYCPGSKEVGRCIDLCVPGEVCKDPSSMEKCPEDGYCPVGSVVPQKCQGLEICSGEGERRFRTGGADGVILLVIVLSIIYLYAGRHIVVKKARRQKEEKNASPSNEEDEYDETEEGAAFKEEEKPRRKSSKVSAPEFTIDLEFERLRLTIPKVGTIMRGVSGSLKHGDLTAIMGPSGAGKTTFLTIMSGKVDRTGGILKVNGEEAELTRFRRVIGFVPQEDIMMRDLTVEENVRHSALMRLPTDWPLGEKLKRVDETLELLEIGHIMDSPVGDESRRGISGGQRKRVNIALEMVMKPSLLCLDEPTSGLDSTTSLTVLQSLKEFAKAGANVVAVLHQPKYEIFKLFDQVLLLGQGGMTVYYGPAVGMKDYFEPQGFPCPQLENPADYYMDVLSGIVPHASNDNFKKEDLFEAWLCAPENPDAVSPEEAKSQMEKEAAEKSEEDSQKKLEKLKQGPLSIVSNFFSNFMVYMSELCTHITREFKDDLSITSKTPGYVGQAKLLLKRVALQRLRSPSLTVLNIVLMILAGAVLPGLVPSDANLYVGIPKTLEGSDSAGRQAYMEQNVRPVDSIPGILTSVYMFMLIVACLSVNVLGSERVVFFRETATGQLVASYWFAKTFETFIWLPIYTAAFVLLGYSSEAWMLQPLRRYWLFLFLDVVGFYGIGMVASLLIGAGSAALFALVFGLIVIIGFSGTVTAYGDASSGMQNFISCWFVFWSTQGLCSEEYDQYRYAFDVDRLNDETPDKYDNAFGIGAQVVGAGVGMGFDLSSSYARNVGFCALTAFAWHVLVLWTLKTKDRKKQR